MLQTALERAKGLQTRVQMPPGMLSALEKLLKGALAERAKAVPEQDSLASSVDTVLALTLPESGALCLAWHTAPFADAKTNNIRIAP